MFDWTGMKRRQEEMRKDWMGRNGGEKGGEVGPRSRVQIEKAWFCGVLVASFNFVSLRLLQSGRSKISGGMGLGRVEVGGGLGSGSFKLVL